MKSDTFTVLQWDRDITQIKDKIRICFAQPFNIFYFDMARRSPSIQIMIIRGLNFSTMANESYF